MVTDTATQQTAGAGALPPGLFRHWIHSREENQGDVQFFRPPGFPFPPSFGRDGFTMRPDGEVVQDDVGAADGIVQVPGRWAQQGPGQVAFRFDGARPDYAFAVFGIDDDLLRIRLARTPVTDGNGSRGWHLAQRDSIRAFRAGGYVLIVAGGRLPNPGHEVDIVQSPLRIFPQQYNLLSRERPGIWPAVVVPYRYAEVVRFPAGQPTVTVHHADGADRVEIESCGSDLAQFAAVVPEEPAGPSPSGTAEATGMSARLSFDEAFAAALANLPPLTPPHPDALTRVQVVDTGGLFGGVAGFHHLYVRVRRTSD